MTLNKNVRKEEERRVNTLIKHYVDTIFYFPLKIFNWKAIVEKTCNSKLATPKTVAHGIRQDWAT